MLFINIRLNNRVLESSDIIVSDFISKLKDVKKQIIDDWDGFNSKSVSDKMALLFDDTVEPPGAHGSRYAYADFSDKSCEEEHSKDTAEIRISNHT